MGSSVVSPVLLLMMENYGLLRRVEDEWEHAEGAVLSYLPTLRFPG